MTRRGAIIGSALFALIGPGLEAGVGPFVLTGFEVGDDLPGTWALRGTGVALIVAGLLVLADGFRRFAALGRGTPSPAAPPGRLVVTGAYRHVRHPMYAATAAVIAGEGLLLRRPIMLVAAVVYVAALSALVHLREEPALARRFGAEYDAYRAAVNRWIPGRRPYRTGPPA